MFNQGADARRRRFARLEGCWWGNGAVYFDATSGGNAGRGPDLGVQAAAADGGNADAIFESPVALVLDCPDNLTVSPQNALLLCEDGGGDSTCAALTLDGEIFDFALNLQTGHEWAGAAFADADPSWNDPKIRGKHRPLGGRWDRSHAVREPSGRHGRAPIRRPGLTRG